MEIDYRDMFLRGAETVECSYERGKVIPFKGRKLPSLLRTPLVQIEDGPIQAYKSGERSSIVHTHKKWFKKKGDNPMWGVKTPTGEPLGGMSYQKAVNELETNEKIDLKLQEFGYRNSLSPVALVEYDMPFENGTKICSAILETFGDTRVSSIVARLGKANRLGLVLDVEYRTRLLSHIGSWLGFNHRILRETSTFPTPASSETSNYAIYRLNSGFAIGRVDFGSATTQSDSDYSKLYGTIFGELKSMHIEFVVAPVAARHGIDIKNLLYGFETGRIAIEIGNEENLVEENGQQVLRIKKEDANFGPIDKSYYDAFDGKIVPQPIERNLVYRLFDTVKIEKIENIASPFSPFNTI